MLKLSNLIIIFFFLLLKSNSFAENKVAYIDLDFVLLNSNKGKEILTNLENNEKKKSKEFEIKELKFKDDENKIISSKNIISKSQLDKDIIKFKDELNKYKKIKSEELKKLRENRNQSIISFFNLINPIIKDYMEKNKISILIDKKNIFVADKNLDITIDIIDIINNQL